MKKYFIATVILIIIVSRVCSQSFTIHLSPDTLIISVGQEDTLSLNATTSGGFSASIFLSLESFVTSLVTIDPNTLNPPYNNCDIIISAANINPGIHQLIIKGEQGALTSYDTAYIKVLFDPNLKWYQFKKENSGLLCNDDDEITIDNFNNVLISTYASCSSPGSGIVLYDHSNWLQWNNNSYRYTDFYGNILTQQSNSMLTNCNGVTSAVAVDSNNVRWIAAYPGLIRQDSISFTTFFPGQNIWCVAAHNNKVWVGTSNDGVNYYDGNTWHSYTTSNSYLPDNGIRKIIIENDSNVWIGTNNGLAHFDLQYWTIYNTSNSILPHNVITAIEVDHLNNKWVATLGSWLIKFDNTTWHQFQPPGHEISAICADHLNNIWVGFQSGNTDNALVKFDGVNWTIYNSANSGFKSDATTDGYGRIRSIKEDYDYTLWISTFGDGVFAYNDAGLNQSLPSYLMNDGQIVQEKTSLSFRIYPNPSNGEFYIESGSKNAGNHTIILYNIQGEIIIKQIYNFNSDGAKHFRFEGLRDGIYFMNISSNDINQTFKIIINRD